MRLSNFKRINTDDLKDEAKALGEKLAYIINPFAEEVLSALGGKLSITDNLNQEYKEISFLVDGDGIPTQSLVIKTGIIGRCKGIDIQYLENTTNVNTYPTAAPFITWTESNNLITIKHITGLQASNKWKMRLLIKGE